MTAARQGRRDLLRALCGLPVVIGWGLLLWLVTEPLRRFDLPAVTAVALDRTHPLVTAAHALSVAGRSWVLVPASLIVAAGSSRRVSRSWIPALATIQAVVAQDLVKLIVARPRPPVRHLEHVTSWSFPSGHATELTAFLVALGCVGAPAVPRGWIRAVLAGLLASLAAAVAASRVLLGVHYPTDVGAGIALGAAVALLNARPFARDPTAAHY